MNLHRLRRALYLYDMNRAKTTHQAYAERVEHEIVEECVKIVRDAGYSVEKNDV